MVRKVPVAPANSLVNLAPRSSNLKNRPTKELPTFSLIESRHFILADEKQNKEKILASTSTSETDWVDG